MLVLPDELQIHIFSYLPVKDLTRICSVCKHFNEVACDPSLWNILWKRHFPEENVDGDKPLFLRKYISKMCKFGQCYLVFTKDVFYIIMEPYIQESLMLTRQYSICFEFARYLDTSIKVSRIYHSTILGYHSFTDVPRIVLPFNTDKLRRDLPMLVYRQKFSVCGHEITIDNDSLSFYCNKGKNRIRINERQSDSFFLYTPKHREKIDAYSDRLTFMKTYLD